MATQAQIILKVRRKVADYSEDRVFEDEFYQDAIEFGLQKLSSDYGAVYTVSDDVPVNRIFLLVKLASIEMLYARAAKAMGGSSEDDSTLDNFALVEVPDLRVDFATTPVGADSWIKLAKELQDEYDGELEQQGGKSKAAEIQVGIVKRISLTNGGWKKYRFDVNPTAVILSGDDSGSNAELTWTTSYDETFNCYEVYRSTVSSMIGETRLSVVSDNHDITYTDEALIAGTYYYRIRLINNNGLESNSNTVSVIIT